VHAHSALCGDGFHAIPFKRPPNPPDWGKENEITAGIGAALVEADGLQFAGASQVGFPMGPINQGLPTQAFDSGKWQTRWIAWGRE
jgi:hypothetical protein